MKESAKGRFFENTAYEETAQAKVDVNSLYNTFYAGDKRMENRMEVKSILLKCKNTTHTVLNNYTSW